jgi:hypothetical protein
MEEIKMLVDMVAHLPEMALWVIAAFWAYKVVVIGSIYGVIKLAINKAHSWLTTPKYKLVELRHEIDGICLDCGPQILAQLRRLIRKDQGLNFLHGSEADWLREAIDEKVAREQAGRNK